MTGIRSIAIIDDDREDYELVLEAMQQVDPAITVRYISTCEQALQLGQADFDLVLLDINMPQQDGFSCLKSIRARGYNMLPVVMYTNSLSPLHIARSYEEGANLYFSKPDSFTDLIRGLKTLVLMDWSDPSSITSKHCQQGDYTTFRF
jgi:DNA-binding response OmpR family regulator